MKRRQGFTLVELLVSMALIIFIMAILSGAFVSATNTFRNLKASGDMAEKLRATTQLLQRDLAADHFEGKKRLSNPYFWFNGPPQQGYFRVWQGSAGNAEGSDLNNIGSYRSVDHMLAFTIKLRGGQMSDFLSATAPAALLAASASFGPPESRYQTGTTYNYQWADVAWFLQPSINPATGQQETTAPDQANNLPGVPLYTLFRRQLLAVPDNNLVPTQLVAALPSTQLLECSCWPNGTNWYFNSPMDLTVPTRRFGMVPSSTAPASAGLLFGAPLGLNPSALWPQPPPPMGNGVWFPPNPNLPAPPYTYIYPLPAPYQPPLTPYYPTLTQQGATLGLAGADIQLTDVVSFDVRLFVSGVTSGTTDPFVTLLSVNPTTNTNVFAAYMNGNPAFFNPNPNNAALPPIGPGVFDTWSSVNDSLSNYSQWNVNGAQNTVNATTSIPLWNSTTQTGPIIQAVQISIRIWDSKTNQTRQVTMVQAM